MGSVASYMRQVFGPIFATESAPALVGNCRHPRYASSAAWAIPATANGRGRRVK